MIDNELRGKHRGQKRMIFQNCIATALGPKYPKHLERFNILKEEQAA